jgi:hypothetical protein
VIQYEQCDDDREDAVTERFQAFNPGADLRVCRLDAFLHASTNLRGARTRPVVRRRVSGALNDAKAVIVACLASRRDSAHIKIEPVPSVSPEAR